MRQLTIYEEAIVRRLYLARRPLTTRQVALSSNIRWQTAAKYLEMLAKKKLVARRQLSNRTYWEIGR